MEKEATMEGSNVGMMKNRIYDANMIAANGGVRKPSHWCKEEVTSIFELLEKLKNGENDGFLLDRYTYWTC